MTAPTGFGAAVRRKEDYRFITGQGTYTDDINRPGQVHVHFLRSPHAFAKINKIDKAAALKAPGVLAVFTGEDIAADKVGALPCGWTVKGKSGEPHKSPPHPVLAQGHVRHVGDTVAMIVAETAAQAKDAAEKLDVDYQVLKPVVNPKQALDAKAPQLHPEAPGNLCYDWEIGDKAQVDAAFKGAHHVTRIELINNRLIANPMEPRAAIAEYDRAADRFTLYTTTQNPHVIRLLMCLFVLGLPDSKVRVVAPDVGGGFGTKIFHYAEEAALTWASKKVGRPLKWTAERSDSFMTDAHGRDHVTTAELAVDKSGKFLALRVDTVANMGAYLSTFATAVPTYLHATLLAGQYTTPKIYANVRAAFTNTTPVDAYRGAGRPEATFVVERLVETAAREMKIDPAELRRRNLIPPTAFPYQTPVAVTYDSGNYERSMDEALKMADYKGFAQRREQSAQRGRLRGIGLSNYIEACGIAPSAVAGALGAGAGLYEAAQIRVNPGGTVTVLTGSHAHGQGHETTFAQLISENLGIPIEMVEVVHGDTDRIPFGMGTYGSRSLAVGGSAIMRGIDKIVAKSKKIAAHLLEAAVEDIEHSKGVFRVAGTDKQLTLGQIALAAYVPHNYPHETLEPGLDETAFYDPANFTFPAGTHVCEVEVDPDTGTVEIVNWVAVDDFGRVVNPMIVEGQVHGGIAQGVGQALLEGCVYDTESGQLVTGSFMDYAMPRAADLPSYKVGLTETPCPHNPLGVKGCGEAGAIAAPAALINAITDAIGVAHIDMPASPEKVWRAAQSRSTAKAAE